MRRLVVVQARMGSSRLPGKVLLPLAGQPLLQRMLQRVLLARRVTELTVATTRAPEDDAIVHLCQRLGIDCFRGHPTDLLDRHFHAGLRRGASAVVKIPSDCPLIDPAVIDRVLQAHDTDPQADFVTNLLPPTWPDGNDVEVMSMSALATAHACAATAVEREHTTPYIWHRPERFRIRNVTWQTGHDLSKTHRFTIDYPEDYAFLAAVYDALMGENAERTQPDFDLDAVIQLLQQRPELRALNQRYVGVTWQTLGAESPIPAPHPGGAPPSPGKPLHPSTR